MKLDKRLDEVFNGVLVAFTKKYDDGTGKFTKDLKHLIELREKQVRNHSRNLALSVDGLTPTQVDDIKTRIDNG